MEVRPAKLANCEAPNRHTSLLEGMQTAQADFSKLYTSFVCASFPVRIPLYTLLSVNPASLHIDSEFIANMRISVAVPFLATLPFLLGDAFPLSTKSDVEPWILYVALQSIGILTISFDPSKNASTSLEVIEVNKQGGFMPGWLTTHNDKVYSVSRTHFPTNNSVTGGIFAFQKHHAPQGQRAAPGGNYSLELLSNDTTGGRGGVACDVSRDGRTIAAASM